MLDNLRLKDPKLVSRLVTFLDQVIFYVYLLVLAPAKLVVTASPAIQLFPNIWIVLSKQIQEIFFEDYFSYKNLSKFFTIDYIKRAFQDWLWKQITTLGLIVFLGLTYVIYLTVLKLTQNDTLANIVAWVVGILSVILFQILDASGLSTKIGIPSLEAMVDKANTTTVLKHLIELYSSRRTPKKSDMLTRVLNANFSEASDNHVLALDEYLRPAEAYHLLVDVGLRWDKIPSLLGGDAIFPEDSEVSYLTQEDREKGWFDVEAVFVSQDFSPNLVSGRMRVPVGSLERSTPYIGDRPSQEPGPLKLPVQTQENKADQSSRARGRLCLYYGAQVLQSALIDVGIDTPQRTFEQKEPANNSAFVDYVLTPRFENVNQNISLRRRYGKGGRVSEVPVKVGLMVNDDLLGTHRILLKLDETTSEVPSLPPAWKTYDAGAINTTLEEVRRILVNPAGKDLETYIESDTFLLDKFKDDLIALGKLGADLYNTLLQGITPEKRIPPLLWRQKFRSALKPGDVIQLARAGSVPSTHVIPWALVYDIPVEPGRSDKPIKLCRVVDEQWDGNYAKRKAPYREQEASACPYEYEHDTNIICPFGFWGYRYTLEQPISALIGEGWDLEPARSVLGKLPIKMAIAATEDVPRESRRLQHFSSIQGAINAEYIPSLPAIERDQVRDSLRAPHLVYVLCHGGKAGKITYLSIGPRDQDARHTITPDLPGTWGEHHYIDIEQWAKTRPLVFINGCYTTDLLPQLTLDFVSSFRDLMAGGVIGTEIQVTVEHGYMAAEKFFEHLSRSEDVGHAILGMRWDLLNEGSFLGLAYTPYAMADLHLEQ